jgi:hypothetical protein
VPSSSDETTGSGVLPLLFGDAFGNDGSAGVLGEGDPALKQYLLQISDLPDGFSVMETSTQQVRDGISNSGTADIATMITTHGQPGADSDAEMLMSMAMHFSDLQDLDKAFSQIDSDAVTAQLGGSGLPAGLFKDVKTLPTDGLGDHATGFSMTMDLGQLLGGLASALGGDSGTPIALPSGVPSEMHMQMYIFARGSYAGAVMEISYGVAGSSLDLLPLAKLADGRLAKAQ